MKLLLRKYSLSLLLVPLLASAALAQDGSAIFREIDSLRALASKSGNSEAKAAAARDTQEKLNEKVNHTAKRAIDSMCVECLGSRYNQPGPKTPLSLPDELSAMRGKPQLEQEP